MVLLSPCPSGLSRQPSVFQDGPVDGDEFGPHAGRVEEATNSLVPLASHFSALNRATSQKTSKGIAV
jgi:hypothetical protein